MWGTSSVYAAISMLWDCVAEVKELSSSTEFGGRAEMWLKLRHREKEKAPLWAKGSSQGKWEKVPKTGIAPIPQNVSQGERFIK